MKSSRLLAFAVMASGLLFLPDAVTAVYDPQSGAGAPKRHGSHGQDRPYEYKGSGDSVQTPAFGLYGEVPKPASSPNQVEDIVPFGQGYSVMIGGGLYYANDAIFGGRITNISRDGIVVTFPRIVIKPEEEALSYKVGDKIERPPKRPIILDDQDLGELDRQFYETALTEVEENSFEPGVIGKAISDSMGNNDLTTSLYIRYRVGQLKQARKDELARKAELAKQARMRMEQEAKTITFVTTIDKQAAKFALKFLLPLIIAVIIAWGIYLFTEYSKKW